MLKKQGIPQATVSEGSIFVVGAYSMERYHAIERRWKEISCDGILNGNGCALAVYDNSIYAIGGYEIGRVATADVNKYSPSASSWSAMARLPSPRFNAAATVHKDQIYVAGGYCSKTMDDFMSYDPNADTWTQLSPMSKGRFYFGLCIVANQLYAVGCGNLACSIEMFNFDEGRWKVVIDEDKGMEVMTPATAAFELPES